MMLMRRDASVLGNLLVAYMVLTGFESLFIDSWISSTVALSIAIIGVSVLVNLMRFEYQLLKIPVMTDWNVDVMSKPPFVVVTISMALSFLLPFYFSWHEYSMIGVFLCFAVISHSLLRWVNRVKALLAFERL